MHLNSYRLVNISILYTLLCTVNKSVLIKLKHYNTDYHSKDILPTQTLFKGLVPLSERI